MVEDSPEEYVHDLFEEVLWGRHPLAKTILGSAEVVGHMDRQKLVDHLGKFYDPARIVIAAVGQVDHDSFIELLSPSFSFSANPDNSVPARTSPQELPARQKIFTKPFEQAHVTLGVYGLAVTSLDRYKMMLLNILLGGNMSSRLFQEIREKRGLAYSVHSYLDSYEDSGYLAIYLGVNPVSLNETLSVVAHELGNICENEMSAEELAGVKDYARSGIFLAAENLEARMTRLARNELYFGRNISFEEVLEELQKVTAGDIAGLARQFFSHGVTAAVLGPVSGDEVSWEKIKTV